METAETPSGIGKIGGWFWFIGWFHKHHRLLGWPYTEAGLTAIVTISPRTGSLNVFTDRPGRPSEDPHRFDSRGTWLAD